MPDIVAKLRKIIWRSLENDFTIAAFQPETDLEFIATGDLFTPAEGITYDMTGEWKEHPKYGRQFIISSYCVKEPCEREAIAVYLEKHIVGIGPVLADKLIERYGDNTIRILKGAPERVSYENKGITYDLAVKISEQLQEGDKRQDVLIQLEGIFSKVKGLPKRLAADLLNTYGLTAFEVVKNNPYVLTDMNRVGFILADRVALACGIKPDDPERIRQGILYVIRQTTNDTGDVWVQLKTNTENLSALINGIKTADIGNAITKLVDEKVLIEHNGYVTLASFNEDEDAIAGCIVGFLT